MFRCFQPIGTPTTGVPRSGGIGREMLLSFLKFMKDKNPKIRIVYLEPLAHPDRENMTPSEQDEYQRNIIQHQKSLEDYYNSLGFTLYKYIIEVSQKKINKIILKNLKHKDMSLIAKMNYN